MNFLIDFFTLSVVLDNDLTVLKGVLAESHFESLNIGYFLLNLVVFGAHEFLGQHVLVLGDEGLLRPIKVD